MSKITFCKIIELENHQVLIMKATDPDDYQFLVNVTTDFEDVRPSIGMGFDDEAKRDKCFEDYNEEQAKKFIETMKEMLKRCPNV